MARKKQTPRPKRGIPLEVQTFHQMAQELSLSIAESEHIETIEEANDFNIPDDDSEDFLQNVTVYEMHEMAEENLALYQDQEGSDLAESNETGLGAREQNNQNSHAQSAPQEQNPLGENEPFHHVEPGKSPGDNGQQAPQQD